MLRIAFPERHVSGPSGRHSRSCGLYGSDFSIHEPPHPSLTHP